MTLKTRLHCTLQQVCAIALIMMPFFYLGAWLMLNHGPIPTLSSMWDIACLSSMFVGLAMLADNVCTSLNEAFKEMRRVRQCPAN